MKNFFKILGVALIAGSMLFVACKKDEENNGNNGNNGGNNNTPTDTTPSTPTDPDDPPTPNTIMTMNIDGVDYDIVEFQGGTYNSNLYLFPYVSTGHLQIQSAQTVGVHDTNDMGNTWGICWFPDSQDDADLYFTYNNQQYPRWENMFGDDVQTITAIDLNAHTISMEYTGTLLDCEMYYNQGEQVVYMEFAANLQNAEWTEVQLSKKAMMKKFKK